jgi:hypothetical protein
MYVDTPKEKCVDEQHCEDITTTSYKAVTMTSSNDHMERVPIQEAKEVPDRECSLVLNRECDTVANHEDTATMYMVSGQLDVRTASYDLAWLAVFFNKDRPDASIPTEKTGSFLVMLPKDIYSFTVPSTFQLVTPLRVLPWVLQADLLLLPHLQP